MIRGYFVGLCQLFRELAYPPLMAATLADQVLTEAETVARMYRRHVLLLRSLVAAEGGEAEWLSVLDEQLEDKQLQGVFLTDVTIEDVFSPEAWDRCGPFLIPLWAAVFITIALTVDGWECVLLGVEPTDPDRPPGFAAG